METVCKLNQCVGCMACIDTCRKDAIKILDDMNAYNAIINQAKCINCRACKNICPQNNNVVQLAPTVWYQGWAKDERIRLNSSSGGFARAISEMTIRSGGVVYSCCFRSGKYVFTRAATTEECLCFSGSKYVKSSPLHVYPKICQDLKAGYQVLFIGLPCQVAALKNFVSATQQDNLYTIDLVCHGTPSPKLLEIFLKQYNIKETELSKISFRSKECSLGRTSNSAIFVNGVRDRYTIAFLNSLIYTENCYSCHYAKYERVSDLTLGDSYGSTLGAEEQKKGISIALCQTEKGRQLLNNSNLELFDVDIVCAKNSNQQLTHPAKCPAGRISFFDGLKKGKKFDSLVFRRFPHECLKQLFKKLLLRLGVIKANGIQYGIQIEE